jgi:hypothetical protein
MLVRENGVGMAAEVLRDMLVNKNLDFLGRGGRR